MDYDRRRLLVATALLMTSGCAKASDSSPESTRPTAGKRSTNPPASTLSARQPPAWRDFKSMYLNSEGRIVDTGNGGISHSEGQGYGMLLAEIANDQESFDSLFGWTEKLLARKDVALYCWRYDRTKAIPVADINNATDGDILIAWALMRAHARWHRPEYGERAHAIRSAIRTRLIHKHGGRSLLLPALAGFVASDHVTINPSYYIWPALDAFRKADSGGAWTTLITDGENLAGEARFGPSKLPCDWIDVTSTGVVVPAADKPARFGFDAIRVPLYEMAGNRRPLTTDVAAYWRSLLGRGQAIPAWIDVMTGEQAPYPLSIGGMAVVGKLLGTSAAAPSRSPAVATRDYYSDVLSLLSALLPSARAAV